MSKASRVLHIRIDGMDQAKFRCPRNLDNSKGWEKLWRPTLHCVGVIVEGVLEAYYITDQDMKKDSNLELTVLSLALDKTLEMVLFKGISMPEHLSLTYDNTAREGKNQHMAKWMAWLVSTGCFRSVQDGNGQVGHTHNKLDQRFSVVANILAMQQVLQTPEDFLTVIQQHVHPAGGRELLVKKLEAAWDWQAFFAVANVALSGIAASHTQPFVCHSKRFVRRQDVPMLSLTLPDDYSMVVPSIFERDPEQPDDVIMLMKEFWSSEALAHRPVLAWNSSVTRELNTVPTVACARNKLSKDQLWQFRRTAKAVQEAPWKLLAASGYLIKWCDQNELGECPMPLPLVFLAQASQRHRWDKAVLAISTGAVEPDAWLCYAPAAPAPITISGSTRAASRKQALTSGLAGAAEPRGKTQTKRVRLTALQWVEEQRSVQPMDKSAGEAARAAPCADATLMGGLPPAAADAAPCAGAAVVEPPLAAADSAPCAGAAEPPPAAARALGCPKCKRSSKGCKQCKNPTYRPRGPRKAMGAQ
jgi:hypothetical protein